MKLHLLFISFELIKLIVDKVDFVDKIDFFSLRTLAAVRVFHLVALGTLTAVRVFYLVVSGTLSAVGVFHSIALRTLSAVTIFAQIAEVLCRLSEYFHSCSKHSVGRESTPSRSIGYFVGLCSTPSCSIPYSVGRCSIPSCSIAYSFGRHDTCANRESTLSAVRVLPPIEIGKLAQNMTFRTFLNLSELFRTASLLAPEPFECGSAAIALEDVRHHYFRPPSAA